jgi:hypothetical protein
MKSFKQFLNEGGNVNIDGVEAERIDLNKINRDDIIPKIANVLDSINKSFEKQFHIPLWSCELFASKKFLSGSAFHFFDGGIATNEFKTFKNTVGDIDTQVSIDLMKDTETFLNANKGKKFGVGGVATLIGYKKSAGQYISLFAFDDPKINIQVDFEFVDFLNGNPTDWSQFSHSSSWTDIKAGVKGVFHKYMLRALTSKTVRDIVILSGKKEIPKVVKSNSLAFSVQHGLREKIVPVMDGAVQRHQDGLPVFKEITPGESSYVKELAVIFEILFGSIPSKTELKMMDSFTDGLKLVKTHFSHEDQIKFINGFAEILWEKGAQGIYKGKENADIDKRDKMIAYNILINALGNIHPDQKHINKMMHDYYASYK